MMMSSRTRCDSAARDALDRLLAILARPRRCSRGCAGCWPASRASGNRHRPPGWLQQWAWTVAPSRDCYSVDPPAGPKALRDPVGSGHVAQSIAESRLPWGKIDSDPHVDAFPAEALAGEAVDRDAPTWMRVAERASHLKQGCATSNPLLREPCGNAAGQLAGDLGGSGPPLVGKPSAGGLFGGRAARTRANSGSTPSARPP